MDITAKYFRFKRVVEEKLVPFGFVREGDGYAYSAPIVDGQMVMRIYTDCKRVEAFVYDVDTGDEYTLHAVDGCCGEFVGRVRGDFDGVIEKVKNNCCTSCIFKQELTCEVIDYVKRKYGAELEFLWDNLPDAAIWRRQDNKKWFGIIMSVKGCKVGLEGDGLVEVMNVTADPAEIDAVADGKTYLRGYHMNKKSWLTMRLDYSVDFTELTRRIDESYYIAGFKK